MRYSEKEMTFSPDYDAQFEAYEEEIARRKAARDELRREAKRQYDIIRQENEQERARICDDLDQHAEDELEQLRREGEDEERDLESLIDSLQLQPETEVANLCDLCEEADVSERFMANLNACSACVETYDKEVQLYWDTK